MLSNVFFVAFVFGTLLVVDAYSEKRHETCGVSYLRLGCFNDKHTRGVLRPMPDMLFTDRDPSSDKTSGIDVDWKNWDSYVKDVVCRCAERAKAGGYKFFGLQWRMLGWKRIHFQHRRDRRRMYFHQPRAMYI
ncbi:uncharacterized protein LOC144663843 isoform X2 [Oculina patagonica]